MLQLNSKNYDKVLVYIRDYDQPIELPPLNGQNLMTYLTTETATKHVRLTDVNGNEIVVVISDIKRIEPVTALKADWWKKYV